MWSNVQVLDSCPAPSSRSKHAVCVSEEGAIYLMGGRSANLPLKDLWKFDPEQNTWEELKCHGNRPPCLQEHSMVCWKNSIYVFGGEIGFASTGETPLWILDLKTLTWKKHHVSGSSVRQPSGRRGHSAIVYQGEMHVFGGYQDLRGSSSELWTFDLSTERWTLLLTPSYFEQPPPRHNHTCVVHDGCMWIYGGLTDLQPRADFWKWDIATHQWSRIKVPKGPGELHSHAAVKGMAFMYIFGGERTGVALNELWRFHFATEIWEKINAEGVIPPPRCCHVAVLNPALLELDKKLDKFHDNSAEKVPNRVHPPKSVSMCFGQTNEHETKRHFKFRVHPVSRFCSKSTSSDEDDENEYSVSYNQNSAQVNLKSLKDKFQSSRLVRSLSSGSYSILHNQLVSEVQKGELEKLLEEQTPNHKPPLKIQKSHSSDAVLESDGESTPKHKHTNGAVTESPPLWVENPNTLLKSSWSENAFQNRSSFSTNGNEHHSVAPTARLSRLAFDGPLATVRDVIEENSENADEPNMIITTDSSENHPRNHTALLIDLGESYPACNGVKTSHTISDFATQAFTPCIENQGLPHSFSHSSGYHSFTEEESGFDCHREFAGCLNSAAPSKKLSRKSRGLELKTFSPRDQSQDGKSYSNNDILLPPPPHGKQRARSLDRTCRRKMVRSYPSGGSITPTILMVEDSFLTKVEPKTATPEPDPVKKKELPEEPPCPIPTNFKCHQWQLCLYVFGGREQGAPGIYRQPISIWKLYV